MLCHHLNKSNKRIGPGNNIKQKTKKHETEFLTFFAEKAKNPNKIKPMHRTFQPGRVGVSIARLVLPQAEGKAAAIKRSLPFGGVTPKNSFPQKHFFELFHKI